MVFLKSEHKDITELLEKRGFDSAQYSFRKKGGQLFIEVKNYPDPFCFYRKTTSELNLDMKMVESTCYFIGSNKEIKVQEWSEVIGWIDKWL